jgi:hemerythrin
MIWKEHYRLGVEEIDRQHEELFRRVTEFLETLRSAAEWPQKVDKVNTTLAFMKDYVATHFRDEEAYQRQIGYPGFYDHVALHQSMVKYVGAFAAQYEQAGCDEKLVQQFAGKLLAWLINHVTFDDQKIAQFARTKGGVVIE